MFVDAAFKSKVSEYISHKRNTLVKTIIKNELMLETYGKGNQSSLYCEWRYILNPNFSSEIK